MDYQKPFLHVKSLRKKRGFWGGLMYMAFNLLNILCILGFVCVCAGDYTDVPWWCAYTGGCWFHHHDGSNLELLMVSFSTCPHISPSAAITVYFIFWAFYSSTVSQVRWSNVSRKKKTILYKGGVMIREFLMAFKKIKPPEEKKTKSSAAALQVCSFS